MTEIENLSIDQLAEALGIGRRDIRDLVKRGVLRRNADKSFDPYQACPAGIAYLAARAEHRGCLEPLTSTTCARA